MESRIFRDKQFLLCLASLAALALICFDGIAAMYAKWSMEEYSHGYLIPAVAGYLIFQKRAALEAAASPGSLLGCVVLIFSLFAWFLGELSSIYVLVQYGFWLGIWAIALLWVGVSGVKVIWPAIFYLVFMIPLPNFIFFNLSQELQLVSSALGVWVIRLFDISVFLEGNVIDLGIYQLQVAEACSGLRYLFPLMSFGFLMAYMFKGPFWQRTIIFLSTLPITVLMNSFRIGVIGVSVEYFGIAAAEGFLHDFEGWIIFIACIGVLLFEIWIFHCFARDSVSFKQRFDLDFGASDKVSSANASSITKLPVTSLTGLLVLLLMIPMVIFVQGRGYEVQERTEFSQLPLRMGDWRGRESRLDDAVVAAIKPTDYFIGSFYRTGDTADIEFYSAWYAEQRKGASIHSPKSCLPGGGWVIVEHDIESLTNIETYDSALQVNRVLMQMGDRKMLVYYWFQGRSRNITNEYAAKWFIFWDSLVNGRSDGALVRLVTIVQEDNTNIADKRLMDFLETFYPKISRYIPD